MMRNKRQLDKYRIQGIRQKRKYSPHHAANVLPADAPWANYKRKQCHNYIETKGCVSGELVRQYTIPVSQVPTVTCADSTCADSRGSRTGADSSVTVPEPLVQIPDVPEPADSVSQVTATYADSPRTSMNILHAYQNLCRFSVTSPTATYADSPRTYEHSKDMFHNIQIPCHKSHSHLWQILHLPVQIPAVSQVLQPPADSPEPVQIPVSHVPQSPVQSLPRGLTCDRFQCHTSQSPVQSLPEPM
ncbi:hypothetical protein TNCV_546291 [Trichonephila clavipes]|nr:hypothetical protein TNCV_546291 [Trichonephila clavipes]